MSTSDGMSDKIIAKAWEDPAFKAKLKSDPHAVLKGLGVDVPSDIKLHIVENTDTDHYFVLPVKPNTELSDDKLDRVAGGDPGWGHRI